MIYADNAATTQMSRTAVDTMVSVIRDSYGNPSSLYSTGQKAKEILESRRVEKDFPGRPAVKTLHFHCRGHRFEFLVWVLRSHVPHTAQPKKF